MHDSKALQCRRSCVIAKGREGYPDSLVSIDRPPERLYCLGDAGLLLKPSISIVGARKSTPYGRGLARRFAKRAAERGITVVSGGALGCDSEAHKGALDAKGTTIVVLGGGIGTPYPSSNRALFQDVLDSGGLVVSEQGWDCPPKPYMFRLRNRIIAALSRATLVVEAGMPSGTFSTADEALAANRDVLAVPGAITSETSRGANQLISQGALPIIDDASFDQVVESLYDLMAFEDASVGCACSQRDSSLARAVAAGPVRIDELVAIAEEVSKGEDPYSWVMLQLAKLECEGLAARYPDGKYGPVVPA